MVYKATNAEIILKDFAMLTAYANEAVNETNPKERLKLLTAGFFAGLTVASQTLKGSPSIANRIGETLQARLPDGSMGYVEQCGAKRTETRVLIYGVDEQFTLTTHYDVNRGLTVDSTRDQGLQPELHEGAQAEPSDHRVQRRRQVLLPLPGIVSFGN
jgi:hypothetical protein